MLTRSRQERHAGLVFSVNLAVSDLLYAASLSLLAYYYFNKKHWVFGLVLCKVHRFVFTCNLYGSMFFIACISVTRYLAIAHPFYTHRYSELKHAYIASVVNSSLTDSEKKKLIRLAAVVVVMYTVSFIPYHVLRNLNWHLKLNPETAFNRPVYWSYQVTKALVALNPCLHPLLYAALLDSVRRLCGGSVRSE
ncbi:hypothetical protein JZ751_028281 [Albula glossodonta]|uniref:G-protein coupled receptors family 1 profile domain-containing protein n=1 Tax=Albula glossodonta TaxID=121402 RepID=A0A8T2MPF6_9TELE|nr:hypothetical protein JZ751_004696 [Albula glossodonta]KAG9330004.1 hypothetical protein JZ751_028281 [Albula glossodonta]